MGINIYYIYFFVKEMALLLMHSFSYLVDLAANIIATTRVVERLRA